ncbi:MAG: hypothetical protein QF441_12465 [Bacteriovoracaceae bacterium]|jgi:hypothetical protein|nr:hypothetical protein [Bacteriovoracaceae bacterium]
MRKSKLIYYLKEQIKGKYIMELKIHSVEDKRYANGVKYALLMIDPKSQKKVLMDNHHPKGPHFHLDEEEFDYQYKNDDVLIEDFKKLVLQHFGEKL